MLIAYFDEVKHDRGRPFYWLGAILADANLIWKLERQVNDLSEKVFGSRELSKETEFHAADIFNGNNHCKGWELDRRLDAMKSITSLFGEAEGLARIYVKINIEQIKYGIDVEETAFMYLVERINTHLKHVKSPGMLIGDRESENVASIFATKLSRYKEWGTPWSYGGDIEYLLDTVHFTASHHSRMLQLADLHTYLRQFCAAGDHGKWHRKQLIEHVQSIPNCLSPVRYKEWPSG
ncbi:MAG: DUF3800 domain-containing protein [Variovorax sp.]|nr:DUF3800 domain-containing protein [Variovorax sp.]